MPLSGFHQTAQEAAPASAIMSFPLPIRSNGLKPLLRQASQSLHKQWQNPPAKGKSFSLQEMWYHRHLLLPLVCHVQHLSLLGLANFMGTIWLYGHGCHGLSCPVKPGGPRKVTFTLKLKYSHWRQLILIEESKIQLQKT